MILALCVAGTDWWGIGIADDDPSPARAVAADADRGRVRVHRHHRSATASAGVLLSCAAWSSPGIAPGTATVATLATARRPGADPAAAASALMRRTPRFPRRSGGPPSRRNRAAPRR